jgi:hypothetical protein
MISNKKEEIHPKYIKEVNKYSIEYFFKILLNNIKLISVSLPIIA